jgi:ABC-type transporter Mla maintaining outer membrane lipid asymmetry ATPase subunit MlaF
MGSGVTVSKTQSANGRPHITVKNLTMAYGSFVLMRDINFTVSHGDIFIIMGGSGCGKSTLLRHLVGLKEPASGEIYPSEISGGMQKRAGLARAMALDPEILFFDEPSAGLDPISSRLLDDLILELRDSLGATVVAVTHELASIFAIGNNCVFLDADSRVQIATGDPKDLLANSRDPRVRKFLTRGKEGGEELSHHE